LTNGTTIACGDATMVASVGITLLTAQAKIGTTVSGLVPDGVARVRFTPTDGPPRTADVTQNFYTITIARTAPSSRIKAPRGYKRGPTIPGPTQPLSGAAEWLDADGRVIGPT
jgi:hypothetical protein